MKKKDKKADSRDIEVIDAVTVKPVKRVVKYTFSENVGTNEDGSARYEKGKDYELTKEQIENYKKNKLICQH